VLLVETLTPTRKGALVIIIISQIQYIAVGISTSKIIGVPIVYFVRAK
jgi:hypothetical protein